VRFDQKIAADNMMRMADIRNKGKELGLRVSRPLFLVEGKALVRAVVYEPVITQVHIQRYGG
jgi:hypothetical protein